MDNRPNTSKLNAADRRKMLENYAYERAFISGEARNFRGVPPAQLRGLENILMAQFQQYKQRWTEGFRASISDKKREIRSANYPLIQTFQYMNQNNGVDMRKQVKDAMTKSKVIMDAMKPKEKAKKGKEKVSEKRERPREGITALLTYPTGGKKAELPWKNYFPKNKWVRMAHVRRPERDKTRTIVGVLINGLPVPIDRVKFDPNSGGRFLELNGRKKGENSITVVFQDVGGGETKTERIHINLNGEGPRLSATNTKRPEFAQFDPNSIAKGRINTLGKAKGVQLAELYPAGPNIDRHLLRCQVIKDDVTRDVVAVMRKNGKLYLTGTAQVIDPPATVRVIMKIEDKGPAGISKEVAREFKIENPPKPSADFVRISEPLDNKTYLGRVTEPFSKKVAIATLAKATTGTIERQVVAHPITDPPDLHKFLEIEENQVVVKKGKGNIPIGPMAFVIRARHRDSTGEWQTKTYQFKNEAFTPNIQKQLGDKATLRMGDLSPNGNRRLLRLPSRPSGTLKRVIVGASVPGVTLLPNSFEFDPTSAERDLYYMRGPTIPAGKTITLEIATRDGRGKQIGEAEKVTLTLGPAQALPASAVNLKDGDQVNGMSRRQIRLGKRTAGGVNEKIGVKLQNEIPDGATVSVSQVRLGRKNGSDLIRGRNAILKINDIGEFELRAGAELPTGTLYVKISTLDNEKPAVHWVIIENQAYPQASAEDVKLINDRIQTGPINTEGAKPRKRRIALLYPAREEVTSRTLTSAKIGSTIYEGITYDDAIRGIHVEANNNIPTGEVVLTFDVTVRGQTAQKETVTLYIEKAPTPEAARTPTTTPTLHPHAMPSPSNAVERKNTNIGKKLYETWNDTTQFNIMVGRLSGFTKGESSLERFTLVTINANKGWYSVSNNGFTTKLIVSGGKIKIVGGGAPSNIKEMSFSNDKNGRQNAMVYAAALNKLMDMTINTMKLDSLSKFDTTDDVRKNGKFFDTDSDLGTVEVEDYGADYGLTETDLWGHTFANKALRDGFIAIANAKMADYMGQVNGQTVRAHNNPDYESPLEHDIKRRGRKNRVIKNVGYSFQMRNLSADYTYSYSGDRTTWFQIPKPSGDTKITIPWSAIKGGLMEDSNKNDYALITISAQPKYPAINKRPKVLQFEVYVAPGFEPTNPTSDTQLQLNSNLNDRRNLIYNLQQKIHQPTGSGFVANENLKFKRKLMKDSHDAIVEKDGVAFARVKFNRDTGESTIVFIPLTLSEQYEAFIVNNGNKREVHFRKK